MREKFLDPRSPRFLFFFLRELRVSTDHSRARASHRALPMAMVAAKKKGKRRKEKKFEERTTVCGGRRDLFRPYSTRTSSDRANNSGEPEISAKRGAPACARDYLRIDDKMNSHPWKRKAKSAPGARRF